MPFDQLRAWSYVDEPRRGSARQFMKCSGRDLADRGSGVLGGEVRRIRPSDEGRRYCTRGQLMLWTLEAVKSSASRSAFDDR